MSKSASYVDVLQHLVRQREEIDTTIRTLKKLVGEEFIPASPQASASLPPRAEIVIESNHLKGSEISLEPKIKPGMFTGMPVWKAALKYLQLCKGPQGTRQIAAALQHGGVGANAKKFHANLHNAMSLKPNIFKKIDIGTWELV